MVPPTPTCPRASHLLALAGVCPESLAQCFLKAVLEELQEPVTSVERLVGGRGGVLGGSEA